MISLVIILTIMIMAVLDIITLVKIYDNNKRAIQATPYKLSKRFWIASSVCVVTVCLIAILSIIGSMGEIPFYTDISSASDYLAGWMVIGNILGGTLLFLFILLITIITILVALEIINIAVLLYCYKCIKIGSKIKTIYIVILSLCTISSLFLLFIGGITVLKILIA